MRIQSLGQEDPLEEGVAARSSILAWRIPWTEEPGRLQSIGSQKVGHNWNNLAQHSQEWSLHFNMVEKYQYKKNILWQVTILWLSNFSVHKYNFYQNTATFVCLHIAYGCYYFTMAELKYCNRDHMACKPKYLLYGPLQKMFANPCKWVICGHRNLSFV